MVFFPFIVYHYIVIKRIFLFLLVNMETRREMHEERSKRLSIRKIILIGGLLLLPILFGMNLMTMPIIGKKTIWISNSSSEVYSEVNETIASSTPRIETASAVNTPVLTKLENANGWSLINSLIFFGALFASLALFFASVNNITNQTLYKPGFIISAAILCAGNLFLSMTSNRAVIGVLRFVIGIAVGLLCALCCPYYVQMYKGKIGVALAYLHGLFIPFGVALQGLLSGVLGEQHENYSFYIIAAISAASLLAIAGFIENKDSVETPQEDSIAVSLVKDSVPDESPAMNKGMDLVIGLCVAVHLAQQLTGINPVLTYSKTLIFDQVTKDSDYLISKGFFDWAGLIGSVISLFVIIKQYKYFPLFILCSGILSGLCFLPFVFGLSLSVSKWGVGLYYMFFSMGIATLPWILPGVLIVDDFKKQSMAIGLGTLFNWGLSSILAFGYNYMLEFSTQLTYLIFMLACIATATIGYFTMKPKPNPQQLPKIAKSTISLNTTPNQQSVAPLIDEHTSM
ncbi:hypothetical protein NECID01_1351 [Nematocida sp. AWRm77]|nr:hypothetical protein NECID01_1351 [Nematocida sp. AWRm77]